MNNYKSIEEYNTLKSENVLLKIKLREKNRLIKSLMRKNKLLMCGIIPNDEEKTIKQLKLFE